MRTYRVAIIGCRARGTAAGRAYHAHPRTEVVGLCDLVRERADALGDELGVTARFCDVEEMLRLTGPDIVCIPTGTEFHYPLLVRVLEHGVHVDVEKPLCQELCQADEVIAKARAKGVRVAVHHQGRVGASMQSIAQAMAAGKIGELRYIYGSGKGYYGGYGLMNIGTHMINNMIRFGGHIRSVSASAVTDGRPISPDDVAPAPSGMGTVAGERITALFQFGSSVSGTLLQHRFPKIDTAAYGMELFGTEGRLFWKSGGAWLLPTPHFVPDGEHNRWQPLEPVVPGSWESGMRASLDDYCFADEYVGALDEGREHECSSDEALHVMETMMAIFESAAYGRRVDLPQAQRDHPLLRWRAEHALAAPEPRPRGYGEWLSVEDRRLDRPEPRGQY